MAWNLHAIEQAQSRGRRRVDGVVRLKFDSTQTAAMTVAVPSVSMVGPTSFVLPPSEMITPSTSPPSKTFSTSCVG